MALSSAQAQKVLERLIDEHHIPGLGFAAAKDGEIVATAAAGVTSVATGLAVTDDTIWQAGSIGKSYTATLVMQLVDDGLLDLDRPVVSYLPDLRFADAHATSVVTARNLLCHTAGIDGDKLDETGAEFGFGDDCLERYVASLSDLEQIVEPGRLWTYCNAGYMVLGRLIEVLRGEPFETVLRSGLYEPGGLKDSMCNAGEAIVRNVAIGHIPGPDGAPMVTPVWQMGRANGPAGTSVLCTLADLLRFADIHMRAGVAADGTRVLSAASVAAMQTPQVACPERQLLGSEWGLGWMLGATEPRTLGHDGNTFGQTAALRFVPSLGISYALISNRHQTNGLIRTISRELIDPWAGTVTLPELTADPSVEVDPARFVGTYRHIGVNFVVSSGGRGLAMAIEIDRDTADTLDSAPRALEPVDGSTFLVYLPEMDDRLQVAFMEPMADGRYEYLHFGGRISRRLP